eukprot:scaffold120367_cov63-Phaeocystis_antarctica.AAC.1
MVVPAHRRLVVQPRPTLCRVQFSLDLLSQSMATNSGGREAERHLCILALLRLLRLTLVGLGVLKCLERRLALHHCARDGHGAAHLLAQPRLRLLIHPKHHELLAQRQPLLALLRTARLRHHSLAPLVQIAASLRHREAHLALMGQGLARVRVEAALRRLVESKLVQLLPEPRDLPLLRPHARPPPARRARRALLVLVLVVHFREHAAEPHHAR